MNDLVNMNLCLLLINKINSHNVKGLINTMLLIKNKKMYACLKVTIHLIFVISNFRINKKE